jgi:hypothetical protein
VVHGERGPSHYLRGIGEKDWEEWRRIGREAMCEWGAGKEGGARRGTRSGEDAGREAS